MFTKRFISNRQKNVLCAHSYICDYYRPNHGPQFHALLESLCLGYLAKQRTLREHQLY